MVFFFFLVPFFRRNQCKMYHSFSNYLSDENEGAKRKKCQTPTFCSKLFDALSCTALLLSCYSENIFLT